VLFPPHPCRVSRFLVCTLYQSTVSGSIVNINVSVMANRCLLFPQFLGSDALKFCMYLVVVCISSICVVNFSHESLLLISLFLMADNHLYSVLFLEFHEWSRFYVLSVCLQSLLLFLHSIFLNIHVSIWFLLLVLSGRISICIRLASKLWVRRTVLFMSGADITELLKMVYIAVNKVHHLIFSLIYCVVVVN
jgi:hypothetical protein